jgi:NADPH-ferrihemoprotein reductase
LLSNTGEGDPPENTIKFVKVLKGKESLDEVKDVNWKRINYSVFGLGNTQYEHYNKTGIEVDGLFEKKGAKRIYKIGLGDDNCSLEDDFAEWKKDLWSTLKEFRKSNPFKELEHEEKAMRKISSELNESFNYISKA